MTSLDKAISVAARFSFKCMTDEVPGMRRILGARRSSQPSATCIGVAPRRAATADNVDDCRDRKSTRLNSSHQIISYAVFCLKKKTCGQKPGRLRVRPR